MLRLDAVGARDRSVAAAAAAARRGEVVLVPTESSYALATDAFSAVGVDAILDAKGLPGGSPLAVMVPGPATLAGLAFEVTDAARELAAAFWPGPLTLLVRPQPTLAWSLPADALLAVRMPLHPVLIEVLGRTGPLVVTGVGQEARTPDDAHALLGDAIAVALDAGALTRPAAAPSIVDVSEAAPRLVREGALSLAELAGACPSLDPASGAAP